MLRTAAPPKRQSTTYQQTPLIDGTGDEERTIGSEQKSTISAFLKDLQELGIGEHMRGTGVGGAIKPEVSVEREAINTDWVPLEMSFGIPLFNEAANNSVCNKV